MIDLYKQTIKAIDLEVGDIYIMNNMSYGFYKIINVYRAYNLDENDVSFILLVNLEGYGMIPINPRAELNVYKPKINTSPFKEI